MDEITTTLASNLAILDSLPEIIESLRIKYNESNSWRAFIEKWFVEVVCDIEKDNVDLERLFDNPSLTTHDEIDKLTGSTKLQLKFLKLLDDQEFYERLNSTSNYDKLLISFIKDKEKGYISVPLLLHTPFITITQDLLTIAIKSGNTPVVQILLEDGRFFLNPDHYYKTASHGFTNIMRLILNWLPPIMVTQECGRKSRKER